MVLDRLVEGNPNLGLDRRAEYFVSLFDERLGENSQILDVGGGWGFYGEPLKKRGHHHTVLDVVKPGFQKTPVVVYDGKQFPFEDKSFDAVLLMHVLHHIPEPESVLREARRVTRKHLIVVEDLYHHRLGRWWTILRDRIYNFEYVGHPCQFKKSEEWIEYFRGLGFDTVEKKEVYTWLAGLRILNGLFIGQLTE